MVARRPLVVAAGLATELPAADGLLIDLYAAETTVASAATCDIGAATTRRVAISGTTTITSLGTQPLRERLIRFTGALTLTHNATSLVLPGAASITTAAGDMCHAVSDASGNWRVLDYQPAAVPVGNGGAIAYTPSVVSASGTITTVGAVSAFYMRLNPKLVYVTMDVTITTNGTGAGSVNVSLPFTAANRYATLAGLELALNNKGLNGQILPGGSVSFIRYYDATYPGANGARLQVNGIYEIA